MTCLKIKLTLSFRSGKEGFYPALEEAILVRIETLCPQLKRIVPLSAVESATISLNIDAELREWVSSISVKDAELARKKTCPDAKTTLNDDFLDPMNEQGLSNAIQVSEYTRILPAIRGTMSASSKTGDIVATCQKNDTRLKVPNENLKPLMSTSKNPSRIKSSDYRAWEKFNIEEALEKVDLPHPLPSAPKLIRPTAKLTPPPIQPSQPTQLSPILAQDEEVKQYQAVMEKYKGNECFKTNDFSEALKFYNRSLDLHPTPQVLTNRAATYLKLCDYESAEIDATHAIALGTGEIKSKAYLRRGQARTKRANYVAAIEDFDAGLLLCETTSFVYSQLDIERSSCVEIYRGSYGVEARLNDDDKISKWKETKSVRMKIEEVEEDAQISHTFRPDSGQPIMNIVDVDDSIADNDYDDLVFE
ncbi:hypothetical protein RTP6_002685 [Batrachochytrium dendrobatidis]